MQIQPMLGYFWAIFRLYQPPSPPFGSRPPFLHILDPPLVTITINIFQMEHFSSVKFALGYGKKI